MNRLSEDHAQIPNLVKEAFQRENQQFVTQCQYDARMTVLHTIVELLLEPFKSAIFSATSALDVLICWFRLLGCLLGCVLVVWLFDCLIVWLLNANHPILVITTNIFAMASNDLSIDLALKMASSICDQISDQLRDFVSMDDTLHDILHKNLSEAVFTIITSCSAQDTLQQTLLEMAAAFDKEDSNANESSPRSPPTFFQQFDWC